MDCIALEENETMRKTKGKACYGTVDGRTYAFRVDGVDGGEFFCSPFGRRLETMKKLIEFQDETEKHEYIRTKRRKILPAVKEWVKDTKPSQFFAVWNSETDFYHDDSVKIFYTKEEEHK